MLLTKGEIASQSLPFSLASSCMLPEYWLKIDLSAGRLLLSVCCKEVLGLPNYMVSMWSIVSRMLSPGD